MAPLLYRIENLPNGPVDRDSDCPLYLLMKNKALITTTIVFFLIVNLKHFWEGKMGGIAFLMFIFLTIVFFVLAIICVVQIGIGFREKFVNKHRNWTIGVMILGLGLVFLKPNGIINFDQLEGEDLFVAQREGVANCMTIFKIKPNNQFKERAVCFGISEARGNYFIRNDTIFFSEVSVSPGDEAYYEFAIVKKSKYSDKDALFRYRNSADTIGNELWITKNELLK